MHLTWLVRCPGLQLWLVALATKLLGLHELTRHLNLRLCVHISCMLLGSLVCGCGSDDLAVTHVAHLVGILRLACLLLRHHLAGHVLVIALVHHHALATATLRIA